MARYVVVHEHDYGISTYLVEFHEIPTVTQVVRCIPLDFEPSKGERLQIDQVDNLEVTVLDWQDGDAKEFDEFADEDEEEGDEED